MSSFSFAQTYSKVVSDSEIIGFISNDINLNKIKSISSQIYPLNINDFYYKDSADLIKKSNDGLSYSNFIFRYYKISRSKEFNYHLDTIFSREDIDFFKKQIQGLRNRKYWKFKFENTIFDDEPELDSTNHTKKTIYNYSVPLFSVDKRKVIIIKRFYCGFLCGGGSCMLFVKNFNNRWVLTREMHQWGE